jgi:hypothetical protein
VGVENIENKKQQLGIPCFSERALLAIIFLTSRDLG